MSMQREQFETRDKRLTPTLFSLSGKTKLQLQGWLTATNDGSVMFEGVAGPLTEQLISKDNNKIKLSVVAGKAAGGRPVVPLLGVYRPFTLQAVETQLPFRFKIK